MQIHQLQPKNKRKTKKRVGRGGKRGTYSGRGVKGQKSRAGTRKGQPIIRELIKRYPKLRGYRQNPQNEFEIAVNLSEIDKHFEKGEIVSPASLIKKGVIAKIKGRKPEVKILGRGKLTKKLEFKDVKMSKTVKEKTV